MNNTKKTVCILLLLLILSSGCATVSTQKTEQTAYPEPVHPASAKNAYIHYQTATELIIPPDAETRYKYNAVLRGGWIQENENLRKLLEDNQQVFKEIENGLRAGQCTLPVVESPEQQREFLYYFERFRELTGLLLLKINYQTYKKEYRKASDSCVDLIKFGRDLEKGGNLFSKRVGMAIENTGHKILRNVMSQYNNFDYPELSQKIQSLKSNVNCRQHFKILLEEQMIRIKFNISPLLLSERNWIEFKDSYEKSGYTTEHVIKSIENCYIDTITYSDLPYYEGLKMWEIPQKPQNPVRKELLPTLRNMYIECGRLETEMEATLIIIGLEYYHHKNGKYPENLSELTPQYLPYIPNDPFSGKSFIYRRIGQGWRLYSVGSDLQNNFAEKHSYFSEDGTGDIIFFKE